VRETNSVLGFCFSVIASSRTLHDVQLAIFEFIYVALPLFLQKMSVEQYHNNIKTLVQVKKEADISLSQLYYNHWNIIQEHKYDFAWKEKQIEIDNLKAELKYFYGGRK
jgi:hypothetical protein